MPADTVKSSGLRATVFTFQPPAAQGAAWSIPLLECNYCIKSNRTSAARHLAYHRVIPAQSFRKFSSKRLPSWVRMDSG